MRFILEAGIAIPYTLVHINMYTHAQTYKHACTLSIPHHPLTSPSPDPDSEQEHFMITLSF